LIGNYRPDKQYSMQIFQELIEEGYAASKLSVSVIRPSEFLGILSCNSPNLIKWFGYVDKFLLFPLRLLVIRLESSILLKRVNYHICDHSNAFYLYFLPSYKTIISCHDVLAIRAGLGYTDSYCSTTKSGKILQRIILNALAGAKKLAAVSEFTLNQLVEIDTQSQLKKKWVTIHNALSEKFMPLPEDQIEEVLKKYQCLKGKAILLHVGSGLERKNRKLLIKMIYELQEDWDGILVLAGAPLNEELLNLIDRLEVRERIVEIHRPTNTEIIALYSSCEAMIFPSYSEGFGWPIIEAQACGAPVITSNKAPMMSEVGGKAALYANPDDAKSFANQFRKLNNQDFRNEVIRLGYENSKRFDFKNTMHQYVQLITE
jgi:glycosyltransferase involved in cell wall biosynthesis